MSAQPIAGTALCAESHGGHALLADSWGSLGSLQLSAHHIAHSHFHQGPGHTKINGMCNVIATEYPHGFPVAMPPGISGKALCQVISFRQRRNACEEDITMLSFHVAHRQLDCLTILLTRNIYDLISVTMSGRHSPLAVSESGT